MVWPQHLRRVLRQLLDPTTWQRLTEPFESFESVRGRSRPSGEREDRAQGTLLPLDVKELKEIRARFKVLDEMLEKTVGVRRKDKGGSTTATTETRTGKGTPPGIRRRRRVQGG